MYWFGFRVLFNSFRPSDAYMHWWSNHHWFRWWLGAWSAPSHYLNRFWNIVNRTIGNKLQWNFDCNWYIFIQENAFENVVWKMGPFSRPRHVNNMFGIVASDNLLTPLMRQAIITLTDCGDGFIYKLFVLFQLSFFVAHTKNSCWINTFINILWATRD